MSIRIAPDRLGQTEDFNHWYASWSPDEDSLVDYDASGVTLEMALCNLIEAMGDEIVSLRQDK